MTEDIQQHPVSYEPPIEMQLAHYQQQVAQLTIQNSDLHMKLSFANQIIATLQRQLSEGDLANRKLPEEPAQGELAFAE